MFNELNSIYAAPLKQWLFVSLLPGTFLAPVLSESVLKGMSVKKHLENMVSLGFIKVHLIYKLLHVFSLGISMIHAFF